MTIRLMLDTNIVSLIARGRAIVIERLSRHPVDAICISAITAGELRFGLARQPQAHRLTASIEMLLRQTAIMPWDGATAERYGALRATMQRAGRSIGELDLLIAAHAVALGLTLVSNDAVFTQIPDLSVEDWTQPIQ